MPSSSVEGKRDKRRDGMGDTRGRRKKGDLEGTSPHSLGSNRGGGSGTSFANVVLSAAEMASNSAPTDMNEKGRVESKEGDKRRHERGLRGAERGELSEGEGNTKSGEEESEEEEDPERDSSPVIDGKKVVMGTSGCDMLENPEDFEVAQECWTPLEGGFFRVRIGPDYSKNRLKEYSLDCLCVSLCESNREREREKMKSCSPFLDFSPLSFLFVFSLYLYHSIDVYVFFLFLPYSRFLSFFSRCLCSFCFLLFLLLHILSHFFYFFYF